jgi:hypothetical protein
MLKKPRSLSTLANVSQHPAGGLKEGLIEGDLVTAGN